MFKKIVATLVASQRTRAVEIAIQAAAERDHRKSMKIDTSHEGIRKVRPQLCDGEIGGKFL